MCNHEIRQAIVDRLTHHGPVRSMSGSIAELRVACGIFCSNTQFKRALGSAIRNGEVVWHRAPAECKDDDERPIKICAAITPSQYMATVRRPYFVS